MKPLFKDDFVNKFDVYLSFCLRPAKRQDNIEREYHFLDVEGGSGCCLQRPEHRRQRSTGSIFL